MPPTGDTTLSQFVTKLISLSDAERKQVLDGIANFETQISEAANNLKESEKERALATKYLNETILDLEKNHHQLREANKFLAHQNEIIDNNLQKLISAYEELEQFTYIASHDLKSPLRTISSYAQLLQTRYVKQLDAKANEYLDIVIESVHNMTDVIDDSLAYSRIGKEGVRRTKPISLKDIIHIVKQNLDVEIKETNATIEYDELPTIVGKQTNFIQLFQNLISNSIKYRSNDPPLISISSKNAEEGWVIVVKDNGRGIDKRYHDTIFQPFKRIDNDHISGSGIGLAICKKICQMYNGQIEINSEMNKGTTFRITIQDLILT